MAEFKAQILGILLVLLILKKIIIILTGVAILVSGIYFKQEFFLMIPLFVSLFVMSFQSEANRVGSLIGAINAVIYTVAYLYMGVYVSAALFLASAIINLCVSLQKVELPADEEKADPATEEKEEETVNA